MDSYVFDEKEENEEEHFSDMDLSSSEEGFMRGYLEEEDVKECSECGAAIKSDKKILREVEGEEFAFCSEECADEFEENLS